MLDKHVALFQNIEYVHTGGIRKKSNWSKGRGGKTTVTGSAALLQMDIASKEYCYDYINQDNLFHWFEAMICSPVKVKDSWNKPISHQPIGKQADIAIFWWSCKNSL